ncbi:MAG: hypothetical protein WC213_07535 [Arenimonas sp.]|jgi:aminoglycoside phosphotransferase family enzyme
MSRLACPEVGRRRRAIQPTSLAAEVAFLRKPESYPDSAARVDAIETHMSWLFLTERHAYKLKKPFRRNGIDYSTPAMRRLNCRRELRLNRRLAEDVYLDVLALTVDGAGRMAIAGKGRPIDWLVRMRRLPIALTLESGLQAGTVDAGTARRIMSRLVPFFASAPRIRVTPTAYRRRQAKLISEAAVELERPEFCLAATEISSLSALLDHFVAERGELLDARARAGYFAEGHGDLRPEHIYLTSPATIIDCIEFDRDLRLHDPVEELAFLAMECDRSGRPELDAWIFAAYRELAGDDPPRALIDYYKALNAFRRARIAIWHLEDPDTGPPQQWIIRANDYLARTHHYLRNL